MEMLSLISEKDLHDFIPDGLLGLSPDSEFVPGLAASNLIPSSLFSIYFNHSSTITFGDYNETLVNSISSYNPLTPLGIAWFPTTSDHFWQIGLHQATFGNS